MILPSKGALNMSLYSESELIKSAIKQVVSESIQEETSSCFRVYKAIVVKPPYFDSTIGNACQVRLIGDPSVLTLPYSSATKNVQSGDVVWVATTSNSFRNAIVWETRYFQNDYLQKPKHYGVKWDKTNAQMTRLYDAANITTNTQNFCHLGSINSNYSNPFDSIYPWSEICLCNIDIDAYQNLAPGENIKNCVSAWEGEPGFSYADPNGVWRYRPSFYGKSWEDDTYRYFDVADSYVYDYLYYPEAIIGRWHGCAKEYTKNGVQSIYLIPKVGLPIKDIKLSTIHSYSTNFNGTLDSIFSIDADNLLLIVEYGTMNSQNAIGRGVSHLYRQSNDKFAKSSSNSRVVQILSSAQNSYLVENAIFDIGTSNGGTQIGSFYIVSIQQDSNPLYINITLNAPVTVTTDNYWSLHGLINTADSQIGSKSGYIGANGMSHAYYRGVVLYGNLFFYVLGAYENAQDHHLWLAKTENDAESFDALNTEIHYDSQIVLANSTGYINQLSSATSNKKLSIPPFCVEIGGTSTNPVGDYNYNGEYQSNTVLLLGGSAGDGLSCGAFYGSWFYKGTDANRRISARPRLKNP